MNGTRYGKVFLNKSDIEKYGIQGFTANCYEVEASFLPYSCSFSSKKVLIYFVFSPYRTEEIMIYGLSLETDMSKTNLNACYHTGQKYSKNKAFASTASFLFPHYQDFVSSKGLQCQPLKTSQLSSQVCYEEQMSKCHTHAGHV